MLSETKAVIKTRHNHPARSAWHVRFTFLIPDARSVLVHSARASYLLRQKCMCAAHVGVPLYVKSPNLRICGEREKITIN